MTMKERYMPTLLLAVLLVLASCDHVSLEDRLINVEIPEVGRAVLIEDYTGQYCVNCPRATQEIERMIEEFGDSTVIAVAIHSGPFSKQKGVTSPLYTEVGDMYFAKWNLSAQPVGLVDRLFSSTPFNYTDWAAGVVYEMAYKAPVTLVTRPTYDSNAHEATIEVQTIGVDSTLVSGKLQVWLTEDSIDSFQSMPDGTVNEHYNHMHVFRASVNDPWGDDLTVSHGEVDVKSYSIKLDAAWVAEHCSFVVFLYDENGVRQVTRTRLTN